MSQKVPMSTPWVVFALTITFLVAALGVLFARIETVNSHVAEIDIKVEVAKTDIAWVRSLLEKNKTSVGLLPQ